MTRSKKVDYAIEDLSCVKTKRLKKARQSYKMLTNRWKSVPVKVEQAYLRIELELLSRKELVIDSDEEEAVLSSLVLEEA